MRLHLCLGHRPEPDLDFRLDVHTIHSQVLLDFDALARHQFHIKRPHNLSKKQSSLPPCNLLAHAAPRTLTERLKSCQVISAKARVVERVIFQEPPLRSKGQRIAIVLRGARLCEDTRLAHGLAGVRSVQMVDTK